MNNSESILVNETNKILWDFQMQPDQLISTKRQDLLIVNKKQKEKEPAELWTSVRSDHRVKLKESEMKDKSLDLAWGLKKIWNMNVPVIPIAIDALSTVTRGIVLGLKDLEIRGRVETIKTTALLLSTRSPEDLRRLAVTQVQ